ncbi:MAG: hypothetical protein MJ065_09455 [Oscillospiraceae bacterium]|nr:hypothetical protein [Oscillospiraceae bacterium]
MPHYFYGMELDAVREIRPVSEALAWIGSPQTLFAVLLQCWSAETCAPRLRDGWSKEDPTRGQCSVTAFLVQDIFGGKVFGVLREGGNYHCYNVIGDCVFDLTDEQFGGEKLDYTVGIEQQRETHFAREEKRLRYELLRQRVLGFCRKTEENNV